MTNRELIEIFADAGHRMIIEDIWPYIGGIVSDSLGLLEAEGFTPEEARFWLEALTILQIYRMGYDLGPVWHGQEVPEAELPPWM